MDGASEYYYYASLTAQESITAEKIKSEGQKIEPDTFAELEVKYRILPLDFLDSNFSINFSLLFSS